MTLVSGLSLRKSAFLLGAFVSLCCMALVAFFQTFSALDIRSLAGNCRGTACRTLWAAAGHPALPLEFVHFDLMAKYELRTALARLRERGDREAVGEGFADFAPRKQPLTPGFAVPSPPGEGCYQLWPRCEPKCRNSRGRACPTPTHSPDPKACLATLHRFEPQSVYIKLRSSTPAFARWA
jgi:hypothetical protein